jgi:hypothetical protein
MTLKFWVFHGGPASRRVVIYLAERGVPSEDFEVTPAPIAAPGAPTDAPGKRAGSVSLFALEDGTYVSDSLAIIEYFDLTESRGLPRHARLCAGGPSTSARNAGTGGGGDIRPGTSRRSRLRYLRSAGRKPAECGYCKVHA